MKFSSLSLLVDFQRIHAEEKYEKVDVVRAVEKSKKSEWTNWFLCCPPKLFCAVVFVKKNQSVIWLCLCVWRSSTQQQTPTFTWQWCQSVWDSGTSLWAFSWERESWTRWLQLFKGLLIAVCLLVTCAKRTQRDDTRKMFDNLFLWGKGKICKENTSTSGTHRSPPARTTEWWNEWWVVAQESRLTCFLFALSISRSVVFAQAILHHNDSLTKRTFHFWKRRLDTVLQLAFKEVKETSVCHETSVRSQRHHRLGVLWSWWEICTHCRTWRGSTGSWHWRRNASICGYNTHRKHRTGEKNGPDMKTRVEKLWHLLFDRNPSSRVLFQSRKWTQGSEAQLLDLCQEVLGCLETGWYWVAQMNAFYLRYKWNECVIHILGPSSQYTDRRRAKRVKYELAAHHDKTVKTRCVFAAWVRATNQMKDANKVAEQMWSKKCLERKRWDRRRNSRVLFTVCVSLYCRCGCVSLLSFEQKTFCIVERSCSRAESGTTKDGTCRQLSREISQREGTHRFPAS